MSADNHIKGIIHGRKILLLPLSLAGLGEYLEQMFRGDRPQSIEGTVPELGVDVHSVVGIGADAEKALTSSLKRLPKSWLGFKIDSSSPDRSFNTTALLRNGIKMGYTTDHMSVYVARIVPYNVNVTMQAVSSVAEDINTFVETLMASNGDISFSIAMPENNRFKIPVRVEWGQDFSSPDARGSETSEGSTSGRYTFSMSLILHIWSGWIEKVPVVNRINVGMHPRFSGDMPTSFNDEFLPDDKDGDFYWVTQGEPSQVKHG